MTSVSDLTSRVVDLESSLDALRAEQRTSSNEEGKTFREQQGALKKALDRVKKA
ncbi:hypothetical protein HK104_000139 [Borealophlyctis nickersoniae]|nr:hypothetical protein HK104_000139 [Borealophlyctis nickersoniae]